MWTIGIFLVVILTIIGEAHAQSSGSGSCLGSINALTLRESQFVTDYTVTRTYVFCPGLVFNIGVLDVNNRLIGISGQEFIQLRPNLHLKCGDSGRRENNCVLAGGDVQVEATDFFGVTLNPTNVRFEGFTFTTTRRYNIWVTKPGDITFVNCAFRDNTRAMAPVYLDYFNSAEPVNQLRVRFEDCTFLNNRYPGEGSNTAIVVANGNQNHLDFERCIFTGNDFMFNNTNFQRSSTLVETSGPISMQRSCFENNNIGVSPVVAYGAPVTTAQNYGVQSNGQRCQFISSFESSAQFRFFAPRCYNFESLSTCFAFFTEQPSASPTSTPSAAPSASSAPPSMVPTGTPSSSPSDLPTTVPSESPTDVPTTTPTTSSPSVSSDIPTVTPSVVPTASPSDSPTAQPVITSAPSVPTSSATTRSVVAVVLTVFLGAFFQFKF